ncbi:MAG: hypothetical protein A2882_01340 [Phenylobacterium sp. RIFCSPHIGHO2_01_FULL_70_10]|nr:MAG: hypothetical protein A2882_01340 [Phenylobacterium sp. RIFCSPHIGHO2_01_FULL_70_10]
MPTNRRVQVADLNAPERLRPVAANVQNYVQPKEETSAVEFMRALGTLNPVLDNIADRLAREERERQEAAVDGKIGGMTFEEFKEARAKDPTLGFTGKWARAALDKQYGIRLGHEVRRKVEEELATADLTEANPEEFLAERIKEAQAELGDSKFARAGFTQTTAGLLDKVRDKVNEDRIGRTVEVRNENAAENFLGTIEWAAGELADPEAMVQVVREQYRQNRDLLGISYRDQDKIMADVLKTLAQRPGMEKYVEALGALDRDKVRLSTKLGPTFEAMKATAEAKTMEQRKDELQPQIADFMLSADQGELDEEAFAEFADRNMDILGGSFKAQMLMRNRDAQERKEAKALAELHAQAKDLTLTAMTPDLVDMARTGRVADIQDYETSVAGKDVSFTRDELKTHALRSAASQIQAEGTAQGLDPVTIRKNIVQMYAENGEVDPEAEARIQAFLHGSATGGDIPASVLNYVEELAAVRDAAPHMVDRIATTEGDRLFIDTVVTGMELGYSPEQALRTAIWRRDNRALIAMPRGSERNKVVTEIVDALDGQGSFLGLGGNDIANRALLDRYVNDRLDYYYATGATGSKLRKMVVDSFMRTHTYLNGQLIDTSGTGLPPSKALPVLTDAAEAIKEAKPAFAKDKITFVPLGRGSDRFMAVTATGQPIPGTQRTWAELTRLHQDRRAARLKTQGDKAKAVRDWKAEQTRRRAYERFPRAGAGV